MAQPLAIREPSLERVKQTGMLSVQGFGSDEEKLVDVVEEEDQVQLMTPLRISTPSESPTRSGMRSAASDLITTPTSGIEKDIPIEERGDINSPSRSATGLGRKESKFRRSVFGLSDVSHLSPLPDMIS